MNQRRTWGWGVAAGGCAAVFVSAGALWFVNGRVERMADRLLRRWVEHAAPAGGFDSFHLQIWRGRAVWKDVHVATGWGDAAVRGLDVRFSISSLLRGRPRIGEIRLTHPVWTADWGAPSAESPTLSRGEWSLPSVDLVRWSDGAVIGKSGWGLAAFEGTLRGLGEELDGARPVEAAWSARTTDAEPARMSGRLTLHEPLNLLNGSGEWAVEDLSLGALAALFSGPEDPPALDGRLDIKTQFQLKDDWLTASHLVTLRGLTVKTDGRRGILGLSAKQSQRLAEVGDISFVVPMTGSLRDPHVGFSSSVEQILYKALEGRFSHRKDLEKWSRRGGAYLGGKIDRALKQWLSRRKSVRA